MTTDTVMDIAGPVIVAGPAGDQTRGREREVLLAECHSASSVCL